MTKIEAPTQSRSFQELQGFAKDSYAAMASGAILPPPRPTEEPSFANLRAFVSFAATHKLHYLVPQTMQTDNQWATQWNQTGLYLFTDMSIQEVAEQFNIRKQNVHQKINRVIRSLYKVSPTPLKEAFPIDSFVYGKPKPLSRSIRESKAHGRKFDEVIRLTNEGKTAQEIRQLLSIDERQLTIARRRGRLHGIEVPLTVTTLSLPFREQRKILRDPDSLPEDRQAVLNQWKSQKVGLSKAPEDPDILRLSGLLAEAGLQRRGFGEENLPQIVEVLKASGVPVGLIEYHRTRQTHRYGILAIVDRDAALEILRTHPDLEQYRSPKLPTYGEILPSGRSNDG